jgi:hypothetical protein
MVRSDPIPAEVREDAERCVAGALNLGDLRRGVEALLPEPASLPADYDEVDLVIAWVWLNCGSRWPTRVQADDRARACVDGYIIATIQAHDLFRGVDPGERALRPHQRARLACWEAESRRT